MIEWYVQKMYNYTSLDFVTMKILSLSENTRMTNIKVSEDLLMIAEHISTIEIYFVC